MKLPELRIGSLKPVLPIIQGGMAVRISTSSLAAAVANEGGIGIIAASGMSVQELREEIRRARALSAGIIGINVMYAVSTFAELFKTALQEKIDLVISGAGFSRDMFAWGKEACVPVVPIVSSVRLAKISEKLGAQALVVEGKEAGGHLGTTSSVAEIVPEVTKSVSIPVIAAGGIVEGKDIVKAFKYGADGVQMGTRFAASQESNAAQKLKDFYVNLSQREFVLIDSPVGLKGRALKNEFTEKLLAGKVLPTRKCKQCLKLCQGNFCIMTALQNAQQGNLKDGLVFIGESIAKIKKIMSVKEIMHSLLKEIEAS
ncbi:MAG: nitronate monooxygenase [Clostridia bacterium]|nr:nitronate monooxygenase [Clostridia bacterium]